mmetsp:Transcript_69553/g.148771  ORF Transcript_69553/g.148771 Transcript_69553/m.148771 type:complete len:249 (-) Transcript_69553:12-758(-)
MRDGGLGRGVLGRRCLPLLPRHRRLHRRHGLAVGAIGCDGEPLCSECLVWLHHRRPPGYHELSESLHGSSLLRGLGDELLRAYVAALHHFSGGGRFRLAHDHHLQLVVDVRAHVTVLALPSQGLDGVAALFAAVAADKNYMGGGADGVEPQASGQSKPLGGDFLGALCLEDRLLTVHVGPAQRRGSGAPRSQVEDRLSGVDGFFGVLRIRALPFGPRLRLDVSGSLLVHGVHFELLVRPSCRQLRSVI